MMDLDFLKGLERSFKTSVSYQEEDRGTLYRVLAIQIEAGQTQKSAMASLIPLGGSHVQVVVPALTLMNEGLTLGEALLDGGFIPVTDAKALSFAEVAGSEVLVATLRNLGGEKPLATLFGEVVAPYWFKLLMLLGVFYGLTQSKGVVAQVEKNAPAIVDQPIAHLVMFLDQYGIYIGSFACLFFVALTYFRSSALGSKRKFLGPFDEDFRCSVAIRFCRLALLTGPLKITTVELLGLAMDVIPSLYAKRGIGIALARVNNQENMVECFRDTVFSQQHVSMFEALSGKQTPEELMGAYATLELMLTEKNISHYKTLNTAMALFVFGGLGTMVMLIFTALVGSVSGMSMTG